MPPQFPTTTNISSISFSPIEKAFTQPVDIVFYAMFSSFGWCGICVLLGCFIWAWYGETDAEKGEQGNVKVEVEVNGQGVPLMSMAV